MHIPYEIQKRLRNARLPQHVLDWIKGKIEEHQNLQEKVRYLEEQVAHKDHVLMGMIRQSGESKQLGFEYPQKDQHQSVTSHYKPWEEELKYRAFYPEYRRSRNEFSMRRGVPGSSRGGVGFDGTGSGSGGSSGGGSSGAYSVIPEPERVSPSHFPMQREEIHPRHLGDNVELP